MLSKTGRAIDSLIHLIAMYSKGHWDVIQARVGKCSVAIYMSMPLYVYMAILQCSVSHNLGADEPKWTLSIFLQVQTLTPCGLQTDSVLGTHSYTHVHSHLISDCTHPGAHSATISVRNISLTKATRKQFDFIGVQS